MRPLRSVARSSGDGGLEPLRAPRAEVRVPLSLRLGADGRVTAIEARWPETFPAAQAACIDQVLRSATFNCPLSGHAQVTTELSISVYRR